MLLSSIIHILVLNKEVTVATKYRAEKLCVPVDGSSTGTYAWCSHLAKDSEAALTTAWVRLPAWFFLCSVVTIVL